MPLPNSESNRHRISHGYSLRRIKSNVTDASVNVCNVLRSSDNSELAFTAEQITDGTLASFVGGNNLLKNSSFDVDVGTEFASASILEALFILAGVDGIATNIGNNGHFFLAFRGNVNENQTMNGLSLTQGSSSTSPSAIDGNQNDTVTIQAGLDEPRDAGISKYSRNAVRVQQLSQVIEYKNTLKPFQVYTFSVYVKQETHDSEDNFLVLSADYSAGKVETETTKVRIEKTGRKKKKTKKIIEKVINESQAESHVNVFAIFQFNTSGKPSVKARTSHVITQTIQNAGNGFYRIGISFLVLEPSNGRLDLNINMLTRDRADNPLASIIEIDEPVVRKDVQDNVRTCSDFLRINHTLAYEAQPENNVRVYNSSDLSQKPTFRYHKPSDLDSSQKGNSKYKLIAPQFTEGVGYQTYANTTFVEGGSSLPAGIAVVTKLYDQFATTPTLQNSFALTTPHTTSVGKLRFCPRIAEDGKIITKNGRAVMRFYGEEFLYSPFSSQTTPANHNIFGFGESGNFDTYSFHVAFSPNLSDYGDGGFDEETNKFRQNYARRQLFGTYNMAKTFSDGANNNDLAPKSRSNLNGSIGDANNDVTNTEADRFTSRLSGTRFFGIHENAIRYEEFGNNEIKFVSDGGRNSNVSQPTVFTVNTTKANWQQQFDDHNGYRLVSGTKYLTRLACINTAEKIEIIRDSCKRDPNRKMNLTDGHHIALKQQLRDDEPANGWFWMVPSETLENFGSPVLGKPLDNSENSPTLIEFDIVEDLPNVDPSEWPNGEPNNAGGTEHVGSLFNNRNAFLFNDLTADLKRFAAVELNVDNCFVLDKSVDQGVKVASVIQDTGAKYRGYLNGQLMFHTESGKKLQPITGRHFILGNSTTGSQDDLPTFINGNSRTKSANRSDLLNKKYAEGYVGDFMELVILQDPVGYTALTDYSNVENAETDHQFIDANINSYYGTDFAGKFQKYLQTDYSDTFVTEELRDRYGANRENIYNGDWDGTFKTEWTDNPAWILYDLMTNSRYGMGDKIDDITDIDIFNLYNIGRYCDAVDDDGFFVGVDDSKGGLEPRFSFNASFQGAENAFNLITNVASSFYGLSYWDGGAFNFAIDRPKQVMAIFNNQNVFDGQFNYSDISKSSRFSRVSINYLDKDDDYKQKVEYVEDEELVRKYGLVDYNVNGLGCTSRGQARRFGRYVLYSNKLETEIATFQAGREALLLSPGDVIRIDDELKSFEINYGKILSLDVTVANGVEKAIVGIPKNIPTGQMVLGSAGGMYVYNNEPQNEMKKLYDMVLFNKSETFNGVEFSKLDKGLIDNIQRPQVSQLRIASADDFIEGDEMNFVSIQMNTVGAASFHKIKVGSSFSVKLQNVRERLYRVIRITEESSNLYGVECMEHQPMKFKYIEEEHDFNQITHDGFYGENKNYFIGVPKNTINRPLSPAGVVFNTGLNEIGKINLTGRITGRSNSTETRYRVALYYPNGGYQTKEFEKGDGSPPQTDFSFFDLSSVGTYSIEVTSLRNPESSETVKKTLEVSSQQDHEEDVLSFDYIFCSNAEIHTYTRDSDGIKNFNVDLFELDTELTVGLRNQNEKPVLFDSSTKPFYDIYYNDNDDTDILIASNISSRNWTFKYSEHRSKMQEGQRDFSLTLNLSNSATENLSSVKLNFNNAPPKIARVEHHSEITGLNVFEVLIDEKTAKDISRIDVFTGQSETGDFQYFYSQNRTYKDNREYLRISKDYYAISGGYETGNLFYKFTPVDEIGTGVSYSENVSGQLRL